MNLSCVERDFYYGESALAEMDGVPGPLYVYSLRDRSQPHLPTVYVACRTVTEHSHSRRSPSGVGLIRLPVTYLCKYQPAIVPNLTQGIGDRLWSGVARFDLQRISLPYSKSTYDFIRQRPINATTQSCDHG